MTNPLSYPEAWELADEQRRLEREDLGWMNGKSAALNARNRFKKTLVVEPKHQGGQWHDIKSQEARG